MTKPQTQYVPIWCVLVGFFFGVPFLLISHFATSAIIAYFISPGIGAAYFWGGGFGVLLSLVTMLLCNQERSNP